MFHLKEITNKYTTNNINNTLNSLSTSLENETNTDKMGSNTNIANKSSVKLQQQQQQQRNEPTTSLLICQITAFNEAKINKFINANANDMIMNFDFYVNNGKLN